MRKSLIPIILGAVIILGVVAFTLKRHMTNAKPPSVAASLPSSPSSVSAPAASTETNSAPAEQPDTDSSTSAPTLTLSELTRADWPSSITLLKPAQIRFKKGGNFISKAGTPLFFDTEYLRDAKEGEQFQILDYDPTSRRVFLRSKDPDGNTVALNTLDLHDSNPEVGTVPANTVVALQGVVDQDALVGYNGDRFLVPVCDTDLLSQAALRRAQNQAAGH
jgi:hypothetical protein